MKRLILSSLGLFAVLSANCFDQASSSASCSSGSEALGRLSFEKDVSYDDQTSYASQQRAFRRIKAEAARINPLFNVLTRTKPIESAVAVNSSAPLKDLYSALKDALRRGNVEHAKYLFGFMDLLHRSKNEVDQFIKDVAPKNIPAFEWDEWDVTRSEAAHLNPLPLDGEIFYKISDGGREDLARLIVDVSNFAREVAENGQEIADIADLLAIDIHNLRHVIGGNLAMGSTRAYSNLAMDVFEAENALSGKRLDRSLFEIFRRSINRQKDRTPNLLLRQKAEDVLARMEEELARIEGVLKE